MKDKDDNLINENSINDLIKYAEDEENETAQTDMEEAEESEAEEAAAENTDSEPTEDTEENKDEDIDIKNNVNTEKKRYIVEDKRKKHSGGGKGVVIGVILGLIAVMVFIGIKTAENGESNLFSGFSKIFSSSDNSLPPTPRPESDYSTQIKENTLVSFDGAGSSVFAKYKKGVICAKMNYMSYINDKGEIEWEITTAIVDPIIKTEGEYIIVAEKGRNKLCLYNDSKLVYDVDDPDTITAVNVSSKGDVIAVTGKQDYKGGISVYNKSGTQIFSWSSGSNTIICADISSLTRRIAVSLLNTENKAQSVIQLFNVNEKESYSKLDVEDTIIFDLQFTGNILNMFGDNRIIGVSDKGNVLYNNDFGNVRLIHSAIDTDGNMLLSFDDGNMPMLSMYNKKGKQKEKTALSGEADFLDIKGKKVLYNKGRDIYFGTIKSKTMIKYTSAMDIKKLILVGDNCFLIVYSNSFEMVTV